MAATARLTVPMTLLLAGIGSAVGAQGRRVPGPATGERAVEGLWITGDRAGVFEIGRCGDRLCGRLVGMRYGGAMPLDVWHRPQCRSQLMTGFRPTDEGGHWAGTILDPDDGNRYAATIWSPQPSVLKLRGYVLLPLFGETRTWTRYAGAIGPACKLAD